MIHVRLQDIKIRILIAIVFFIYPTISPAEGVTSAIIYSDRFSAFYPQVEDQELHPRDPTPLENPVVVWSPLKHHKAIFLRTDGTKVPYDQSIGSLMIESESGKKRHLSLKGFRHVELNWINERLLYIRSNIGHVVSVSAIFDIEEGIWIYRKSEEYIK